MYNGFYVFTFSCANSKQVRQTRQRSAASATIRLQRRRNSLVPIARLPPEVLSSVVLINVLDGKTPFTYKFNPKPPSDRWLNVTFVCHHWREVALNYPRIGGRPYPDGSRRSLQIHTSIAHPVVSLIPTALQVQTRSIHLSDILPLSRHSDFWIPNHMEF